MKPAPRVLRVGFGPDPFLDRQVLPDESQDQDTEIADRYAASLMAELQPLVGFAEVATHPRRRGDGGPGVEFDLVELVLTAGAIAGGYAGLKEVVRDVRRVLRKLGQLGDGRVYVDAVTATLIAIDAAGSQSNFDDIEVGTVNVLRGNEDYESERGYLIQLFVNGVSQDMVVTAGGSVLGGTSGTRAGLPRLDGLNGVPPDEDPNWEEIPEDEVDRGDWVPTDDGSWSWRLREAGQGEE